MHLFLPLLKKDKEAFRRCAILIGFDEFVLHKFVYTMQDSDVDIYQLMYDERLSLLIYGWEICDIHMQNSSNAVANKNYTPTKNVQTVMKWLARYSLDLWLSREWDSCDMKMCKGLLHCLRRVEHILTKIPDVGLLNWNDMFKWDVNPWAQPYVTKFLIVSGEKKQMLDQSIEEIEQPACKQDIDYLREENIFMIMARLVKMIDSFFIEGAKQLSMRVLAAWNAIFERAKDIPGNITPQIPAEFKECVINICHIYLMTVYETDSNRGFVIDNMMNNIRFYHQSFLERNYDKPFAAIAQLTFTPARFIALTCINLNVSINKFIEMFSNHAEEKNFSTLFGVISQSYISYILGNQLMEMNNMNEEHFNEHIEHYKNIFNTYINEREISEIYLKDQLQRREQQRNSHSMSQIVKILTDFESKFCKGNRSSNMGNYENGSEDEYVQTADAKIVRDKNTDAIFENMPNNEEILNYVYRMLADRTYDGWHCAKIVLLLKIIGIEVNVIETWRYHPGLTTQFMLGIETKLSKHYEDLALLFHEHFFLEQEFWLTAFYLNPIRKYYAPVIRCGMRFHRILQHIDGDTDTNVDSADKNEKYAKYGLLSSTIDVKEIVKIRNHDTPKADYDALSKSLSSLNLSEQTVKDLLTVTFLPRNKSFAWAVNWDELRKRCKKLLKVPQLKRRLVELNMAEANDRLKYLNINYEKYKNRPQLDYGSIEEGYENLMNFSTKEQSGKDSDNDDDVDDDDEDDDEDEATGVRDNHLGFDEYDDDEDDEDDDLEIDKSKLKIEKRSDDDDVEIAKPSSKDIEQIIDMYSSGTRRTRARTAAALASANMNTDNLKTPEKPKNDPEPKVEKAREKTPIKIIKASDNLTHTNVVKRNLKELLQERSIYSNATPGFEPFPDIWDFDAQMLQTVDKTSAVLTETENLFGKLYNLKTTFTKNESPDELSSSLNEVLVDETTLSATEYDIHEIPDLSTKENNINEVDFDRQISKEEVFDKETVDKITSDKEIAEKDKEVANIQALDREVVSNKVVTDKEASVKETTEKEASDKEATNKEMEENRNNVIDINEAELNMEQTTSKIIELQETDLDEGEIVESKVIDLDESEQDIVEEECKEIEPNEIEQALTEAESKQVYSNKTEQEMETDKPENIDLEMLLNTTIIDTDIDESMEICEIPPKESNEQVEEINLIKAAEDIEEDQQNVVIMLADLTEADEASQNVLEIISDIVIKPGSCDAVTVVDEAQEELNQEVQKFTYDDGEENSQSDDVIITTYMDLNSETTPNEPSDSPALVSCTAIEDLEMQSETTPNVPTLEKAVLAAEKISSAAEEATQAAKEDTLAVEEATLAAKEATLAEEEAILAAEEAILAEEEATPAVEEAILASADVEVTVLGAADVEKAIIEPANIEEAILFSADAAEAIHDQSDVAEAILAPAGVAESRGSPESSANTEEHSVEPIKSNEVIEVINEPIQTETSPNSETEEKPDETNDQPTEFKIQTEQSARLKTEVENTENKDQTIEIPPEIKADKEIAEDRFIETKSANEESQAILSVETEETKEVSQEFIATDKGVTAPTTAPIPDSILIENKCETNANSVLRTEELKESENITKSAVTPPDDQSDVVSQEIAEEVAEEKEEVAEEKEEVAEEKEEVAAINIIKRPYLTEESTSSSPTELLPAKRKKTKPMKYKVSPSCKEKSAEKSNDEQQLSDSIFATKDLLVRIKRLKVADCKELRQPRVFVNRVTKDSVNLDVTAVKMGTDSIAATSSFNLRPHRKIQFKRHYSQSSTTSDDDTLKNMPKLKFARKQTAKRRYVPSGRPLGRPRKLVATPRSASGLKLRISSTNEPAGSSSSASTTRTNENIELIHISSSSSSPEIIESSDEDLKPLPVNLKAILDPLYEEEIILCD